MKKTIFHLATLTAALFTLAACSDDDSSGKGAAKTYAVGDFYNVAGVKGVVYKLDDATGKHGMIVSLDETTTQWATQVAETELTGADNNDSGKDNMAAIQRITGWQTKFPAFAWCAAKNAKGVRGWVLPAYAELRAFYDVWTADRASFNKALTDNGGKSIDVPLVSGSDYWSSTVDVETGTGSETINAETIEFYDGTHDLPLKTEQNRVRAVRAF